MISLCLRGRSVLCCQHADLREHTHTHTHSNTHTQTNPRVYRGVYRGTHAQTDTHTHSHTDTHTHRQHTRTDIYTQKLQNQGNQPHTLQRIRYPSSASNLAALLIQTVRSEPNCTRPYPSHTQLPWVYPVQLGAGRPKALARVRLCSGIPLKMKYPRSCFHPCIVEGQSQTRP